MSTVIEAVYENGVLKPLMASKLKEQQRYRVILQEVLPRPEIEYSNVDPELAAELERRTTILPDGRKLIDLENIMARHFPAWVDIGELLEEAMQEVRRERQAHFEAELDEFFPLEEKSGEPVTP
jgi:predicted DNA-binding antitoxin AbrB/MazE fold protein